MYNPTHDTAPGLLWPYCLLFVLFLECRYGGQNELENNFEIIIIIIIIIIITIIIIIIIITIIIIVCCGCVHSLTIFLTKRAM